MTKFSDKGQTSSVGEAFKVELRVQAKKGCGEATVKLFKKLFDPERRFKPIPQVVYYSIREGHIAVNFLQKQDFVTVEITPGPHFKSISEDFAATLKNFGFVTLAKEGFNFETKLSSPDSFLDKARSFATCEDDYFFPHLLSHTTMETTFDKKQSHLSVLDSFLNLAIPDRRLLNFSCLEFVDIEAEIDLDKTDVLFQ